MSARTLIIQGARQNNLKNITLSIPHNKVIAITGVSGSGKSSLAFDTVFAEGQWRFIESLSTYARLFLEKLDRPDVDAIHNIRPAIALEQRNPVRGSRSTVGTLTEIYDLFRLLYSKIAIPYCPECRQEIRTWDTSQVVSELINKHRDEKAVILFESNRPAEELKKKGFYRAWIDGEIVELGNNKNASAPPFTVILDRLVIRDEPRLADSIEIAWKEGEHKIRIALLDHEKGIFRIHRFSGENCCDECAIEIPAPYPLLFSFNHPVGACPECKGFGNVLNYDEDLIIPDKNLSVAKGAVDPWNKPAYRWWKRQLVRNADKIGIDVSKPYAEFSAREKSSLFKGGKGVYGIDDFFDDLESRRYKLHVRVFLSRYRRPVTCSECKGKRLRKESLMYKIAGLDIADLTNQSISDLQAFFEPLNIPAFQQNLVKELLRQIHMKLDFLKRVGLAYLTLNRDGRTLSGGEYQRVNLSNQLASFLTGTLYVLDEPTVGLHVRDTHIVSEIMSELSQLGNTLLVVEHDKGIIQSADWVVELGPGGGHQGGEVVFCGSDEEFLAADTVTARYINGTDSIEIPSKHAGFQQKKAYPNLVLHGARGNNLQSVDLAIPLNTMTTVTGVSGSGKSSLVVETLYRAMAREYRTEQGFPLPYDTLEGLQHFKGVKLISQSPIGRSPRSNPVTYLKVFDLIRTVFSEQTEAKANGYRPGYFSFNVAGGRCETCKGAGYQKLEMYFFEDLYVQCEVCNGKRYKPDVLRIHYRGKNIHDVLQMTVDEAVDFFQGIPKIQHKLSLMQEIGMGYLRLGQPATMLSGGEAQRLKICAEMIQSVLTSGSAHRKKSLPKGYLYILDEPTIGLHFRDVKALLGILRKMVGAGNTVLLIEHNMDVIMASDWIIDMGPEGGIDGGKIIFEGPPDGIADCTSSHTGQYIKEYYFTHTPTRS
jgi:excinuclease ABC subunit A